MNTPLQDDWSLELTLLGIGGAFDADHGLANTNAMLTARQGQRVAWRALLDCGHTCGRQLAGLGLNYSDIDAILITHTHGDHIDGLEVAGYKNLFLHQHRCQLIAPRSILEGIWTSLTPKMQSLQTAPGEVTIASLDTYFDTVDAGPVEGGRVELLGGRLSVDFLPVPHVVGMDAYALLFSFGDDPSAPTLRWSGDTIFAPDSPMFDDLSVERGDLIFHDCTFSPYHPATVHTHLIELQTLPAEIRQHIVLVHHGKLDEVGAAREGMRLAQPLEIFRWPMTAST